MRTKLTIAVALGAFLLATVAAHAGPVTVALYRFKSAGDVRSFYKIRGNDCKKSWRKRTTLGVAVGAKTNACWYRSSVVGDSSDPGPDQEMAAAVNLAAATPPKLRKKVYMGVAVRHGRKSSYELRLFPAARAWQVWRDPAGSVRPFQLAAGKGPYVRLGVGVRNNISLRAFDFGTSRPWIVARVNGRKVFQVQDERPNTPNGRRTVLTFGAKGKAFAKRAVAAFANVAIRVPDPFAS